MFRNVTLRGPGARIAWGYHTAAVLRTWAVHKNETGAWTLTANIDRADPFQLKQSPLLLTAPRRGGFFCWPVKTVTLDRESLTATLDAPLY